MTIDPDTVLRDALSLPTDRRAQVAAELLASLDESAHDSEDAVRAQWAEELEVRALRVMSGEDAGEPWNVVRERVRSKFAQ